MSARTTVVSGSCNLQHFTTSLANFICNIEFLALEQFGVVNEVLQKYIATAVLVLKRYVPLRTESNETVENVLDLKLKHHVAVRSVLVQIGLYFASPSSELCLRPRHLLFLPNALL